jgi:flagellar basal body-associated protein FliL
MQKKLKKIENHKKAIKDEILMTCSPATAPEKGLVDG